VLLEVDDDLDRGEFGIATRMVQPRQGAKRQVDEPEGQVEPGATMIYRPKTPPPGSTEAADAVDLGVERDVAWLEVDGRRRELAQRRVVIGRSKDTDIQVPDPNISRRHAEIRQEGATYWIVDLDSTNGLEVNGRRLKRAKLADGDTITIGSSEIKFVRETQ
jgi:hypothetical protein